MSLERRLRRIMTLPRDEREVPLRELAQKLGCSLAATYTSDGQHLEDRVIQRIREATKPERESRWWSTPAVELVVGVLAAVAAWIAVFR